jgi:TRAP-type C4-dicarboxylate transport system permease small subunit
MRPLKQLLTRLLELAVILIMAALVCVVLWGVFSRFILAEPSRWTEELATFLLTWVALLGAAVGFSRQQHLGVDVLVNLLDPAARRLVALVVQLLILLFSCAVMLWGGYVLVSETLISGQTTPALGLRMGYVYLAVPISGLFIVLFSLEQLIEVWCGAAATTASESPATAPSPGNSPAELS